LGIVIITGGVACPFTIVEKDPRVITGEGGYHGASSIAAPRT